MDLNVCFFKKDPETDPKLVHATQTVLTWDEVIEFYLTEPAVSNEKDKRGINFAKLSIPYRKNENVVELSALCLDFDHDAPSFDEKAALFDSWGYSYLLATTWSHTPDAPRYRAIFPLASAIPASEYAKLWQWAFQHEPTIDKAPKAVSNLFFLPYLKSKDSEYRVHIGEGEFLDWQTLDYSIIPQPKPKPIVKPYQPKVAGDKRVTSFVSGVLRKCADKVANAAEGTGNRTLFNQSRVCAGFHHYGVITENDIANMLENATLNWNKRQNIQSTIRNGIRAGIAAPLQIPDMSNEVIQVASHITPVAPVFDNADDVADEMARGEFPIVAQNDSGFIELFCLQGNCQNFVYAHDIDKWLAWTGQRWDVTHGTALLKAAMQETLRYYQQLAVEQMDNDKQLTRIFNFLNKYGNSTAFDGARKTAQNDMRFRRSFEEFDKKLWLLNCQNGTIDLKSGELLPFKRDDLITVQIPVSFENEKECPNWERFVSKFCCEKEEQFLASDLYHYFISWLYYCFSGDVSMKVFTVWQGTSNSGKSTLNRLLNEILGGDLSKTAARGAFAAKDQESLGHQSFLARLQGSRLVVQAEFGDKKIDTGLAKAISGGDVISAAKKFQEEKEAIATYKLNFFTNETPRFNVNDDALFYRLRIIPCMYKPTEAELKDGTLDARLKSEAGAILAHIVKEGRRYFESKHLAECAVMKAESDKAKETQDHFKEWVLDVYEIPTIEEIEEARAQKTYGKPNLKHPFKICQSVLSKSYLAYCQEQGYKPIGRDRRNETLKRMGVDELKTGGNRAYGPLRLNSKSDDE